MAKAKKPKTKTLTGPTGIPYTRCTNGLRIQTLIFPLASFTPAQARSWAVKHGFRASKVDVTSGSTRIRQRPVELFLRGSFRTISLGKTAVRAVVGCPRFKEIRGKRAARQPVQQRKAA